MKNISIILLFVIAIACSSKLKKKELGTKEQALSVLDNNEVTEQEMSDLYDNALIDETVENKVIDKKEKTVKKLQVKEIKVVEKIPEIKIDKPAKKITKKSSMMVFDKTTKSMISIENCSHVIYNGKQFSQPTCLKTL